MRPVTIYTTDFCGYCLRAKALLDKHEVPYVETDVTGDHERRSWLVETTGRRTVPQIFFGDEPIGGYDELAAIVRAGRLRERLAAQAS
jgi:glutaredoxin 3